MDWSSFLLDIAKMFVGALVGGGLAFHYALRRDEAVRRRDQKAAGNLALAILARQFSDFQVTKLGIDQHIAWVLKEDPKTPLWLQLKPIQADYSVDTLRFDIKSLEFLFQRGRGEVLEHLINAELAYRDFARLVEVHGATREEAQRKMSDAGIGAHSTLQAAQDAVGWALVVKLRDFTAALLERTAKGGKVYLDAADALRRILVEEFGDKEIIHAVPKSDSELRPVAAPKYP